MGGHQIGQGGNAKVFVGMNVETGAKIAVKELDMWNLGLETTNENKRDKKTDAHSLYDSSVDTNSLGADPYQQKPKYGKITTKSNSKMALLRKEITIMKKLAHRNIVRYLGTDI